MKRKIVIIKSSTKTIVNTKTKTKIDPNAETKKIVLRPIKKEVYRANRIRIDIEKEIVRLNNLIRLAENIQKANRTLTEKDQNMIARRINKLIKFANLRSEQQVKFSKKHKDANYYNRGTSLYNEVLELMLVVNKLELIGIVSKGFGKKAGIYLE